MGGAKRPEGETTEALTIPDHEMLRRIGDGSYGEVWLARSATGVLRAVKIVRRDAFDNDKPFEREFNGLLHFEPLSRGHEGLVDILQVGCSSSGDSFYCIMELADAAALTPNEDGRSKMEDSRRHAPSNLHPLSSILDPATYQPLTLDVLIRQRGGRLPVKDCLAIANNLASALQYLHNAGLVHRDIKPSNIIFVGGVPKLADVGLVARTDSARTFVGTEGFLPPEGPGTPWADIYSLGKCLYEMAMGKDRQAFPSPPTLLDELPDREELLELNEVITKACEPDPKDRHSSAEALVKELAILRSGTGALRRRRLFQTYGRCGLRGASALLLVGAVWLGVVMLTRPPAADQAAGDADDCPSTMKHPFIRVNPTSPPPAGGGYVAVVNPDYWRAVKYGRLEADGRYYPIAEGSLIENNRRGAPDANWSGVGQSPDYLSLLLADAGTHVDVFWSSNFPAVTKPDYAMVVVQDPLTDLHRNFDRAVEGSSPDLLERATNGVFLERLDAYYRSGGVLLLVGDAVCLLGDGPGRLNYGVKVTALNITNQLSLPSREVPAYWMFIRGQSRSGSGPEGVLTASLGRNDNSGEPELFSRVFLQDRVDLPRCLIWGETLYVPMNGEYVFKRLTLEGKGDYSQPDASEGVSQGVVGISGEIPLCAGVTVGKRRVAYLPSDAPFELRFRDFRGASHTGNFSEVRREMTPVGEAALLASLLWAMMDDQPRAAVKEPAEDPYDSRHWTQLPFSGEKWFVHTNGCQIEPFKDGLRIHGEVAAPGWGRGNGIYSVEQRPPCSFTASLELNVPIFQGTGIRLVYFAVQPREERPCAVYFQPGKAYGMQRFGPNVTYGGIRPFGDEEHNWHRLVLRYDAAQRLLTGYADDQQIAQVPMAIAAPIDFWFDAATDKAGTLVDVRVRNFEFHAQPAGP